MAGDGSEIATGHVSIFPVLKGVRAAVEKELKASGKTGASAFNSAFGGRKLGHDSGQDVAKAFDAATQQMGEQAFRKLTQDAAKASQQVAKARETQRSSAAAVTIAEQKLAEAIAKYGENSSQAMSAQERLTAAQHKNETATESLTSAQDKLARARKAVFEAASQVGKTGTEWLGAETERLTARAVQQRQTLANADKNLETAEQRLAAAVEKYGTGSMQAATAAAKVESARSRQKTASDNLARTENDLEQAQKAAKSATDQTATAMKNGASATDVLKKGMESAGNAASGIKNKLEDATEGLRGWALGAAGFAGVGATIGAAISSGLDQANLGNKLKAALGDEQAAAEAANVVSRIYADGWGESLDEVRDAVTQVKHTLRDLGDDSEENLETIASNALVLSDVFGADVNESVRGVNALMKWFGLDATEATDLLTAGMQRGLNYTDELGDNLSEYAGRWGEAGMSASQYFSLLQAGTDAGAYNLDKVGDYLNEFLTSLSDGRMDDSIGRFSSSTQQLWESYKNGGATAGEMLNAVIGDLKNTKNETERAAIASELWSSLGEDNAMGMILALGGVEDSYKDVTGAAKEAEENNRSIQQSWQKISRTVMQSVGKELAPLLADVADQIGAHGDEIGQKIGEAAKTVIDLVKAFAGLPQPVQLGIAGLALFGGKINSLLGIVKTLGGGLKLIGTGAKSAANLIGKLGSGLSSSGKHAGDAGTKFGGLAGMFDRSGSKAKHATGNIKTAGDTISNTGGKASSAGRSIGDAAGKVDTLSDSLDNTGSKAKNAAGNIDSAGEKASAAGGKASGASQGFSLLGGALGGIAIGVGLYALTDLIGELTEGSEKAAALKSSLEEGGSAVADFLQTAASTGEGLNWGFFDTISSGTANFNSILQDSGVNLSVWSSAVTGSQTAVDSYNTSLGNAYQTGQISLDQYVAAKNELAEMQQAYQDAAWQQNQMVGSLQSLQTLQSGLSSSMGQLNTTIKANGTTLDESSAAGQANRAAMESLANQAIATAQATLQQGEANGNMSEATQQAKNSIYEAREAMVEAAQQCGMSKEEADEYANSLGLIPGDVGTTITQNSPMNQGQVEAYLNTLNLTPQTKDTVMQAWKDGAINNINDLNNAIHNVPKEKTTDLNAKDNASRTINSINGLLNLIPGVKTIKLVAQSVGNWFNKKADGGVIRRADGGAVIQRATGGAIPRFASGGNPGGLLKGPGTPTSDSIPLLASTDEFVIRAAAARRLGIGKLERANATGRWPGEVDSQQIAQAIATAISGLLQDAGTTNVNQTFIYPAIAPTSISTQQKLQTAAMPQW
ncbi:hypothetical protein EP30_01065 [Bifidobacterium sp. UTCIF-39]|uniref:phage tail tape measure protein n=1 Tax=Bifidobacterium sp. UTCIF-39 TaxID=1465359 RepID=UPI00112CD860|nr:phage tail tape measure protein [Bifidobacterium sp. UTCIF-39]TPF97562.1 hypothetical protein EP30_01065 [Bifidobacterium sp. UTCIF-39]